MRSTFASAILSTAVAAVLGTSTVSAVTTYTETFNSGNANWYNGANNAYATHIATGGVANSGYISYTSTFTGAAGMGDPLQLLLRGNNAQDASGDAFVGNWIADGVETLTLSVRHSHTSSLYFYSRLAGSGGAGASTANNVSEFLIAPNLWTTIEIDITNSNPPFVSFGSSTFNGVFGNLQNLTFGLYVADGTTYTDLKFDIDNVSITANPVPEPTTMTGVLGAGVLGLMIRRRRKA
jgi:hypothetical protein